MTDPDSLLIVIGRHASERMLQRQVTLDDVKHALGAVTMSWHTRSGSIQYIGPGVDGRMLKVWLRPPGMRDGVRRIVIATVAWKGEEDTV